MSPTPNPQVRAHGAQAAFLAAMRRLTGATGVTRAEAEEIKARAGQLAMRGEQPGPASD